jgi:hypothetical protein
LLLSKVAKLHQFLTFVLGEPLSSGINSAHIQVGGRFRSQQNF